MSRRARSRNDKRATALALAAADAAPFHLVTGETLDPRAPWQLPGPGDTPSPQPDPWSDWEPSKAPIPVGPLDVAPPIHR